MLFSVKVIHTFVKIIINYLLQTVHLERIFIFMCKIFTISYINSYLITIYIKNTSNKSGRVTKQMVKLLFKFACAFGIYIKI